MSNLATADRQDAEAAQVAALRLGLNYVQTIVTISSAQAAGTAELLPASAGRHAVQFGAAADFKVALAASAGHGLRIYGSARDDLAGLLCPTGALYLVPASGLAAGDTLVVWEA